MVLGVASCGLFVAEQFGWAAAAGLDVWNYRKLERQLAEQEEIDARFAIEYDSVSRRIAVKEALTAELVEGRSSFAEVLEKFQSINGEHPGTIALLTRVFHVSDPREATARSVIEYVQRHSSSSAAQRSAALSRIAAEFGRMFPGREKPNCNLTPEPAGVTRVPRSVRLSSART
jgi:hypothetical protein